jgi:hypothetical protein
MVEIVVMLELAEAVVVPVDILVMAVQVDKAMAPGLQVVEVEE